MSISVTPLAGVWIEIANSCASESISTSLPLRECGLKFFGCQNPRWRKSVTPLAGVWIEISCMRTTKAPARVTPLAGVWIEIWEEVLHTGN